MRRIDRLDAATGRLLPPVTLPRAQDFDLTTAGGNGFAQGLLVLQIVPPCTTPGCPVAQTIAVDPPPGRQVVAPRRTSPHCLQGCSTPPRTRAAAS